MTRKHQPRKSAAQWQQLIQQQQASGLSASHFCQQNTISYASFCQWRRRFAVESDSDIPAASAPPAFIDLETWLPQNARPWNIVLRLGNGIELCLSQS